MDTKIAKKAVALVARAKAHHDQSEVCWHGRPGGITWESASPEITWEDFD